MPLSPYVPVHQRYASEAVREDEEFWQHISAITDVEAPGWNTEAMGDAGCSHGLFQMNQCGGAGTGYTRAQLTDPDFASRIMIPQFEQAYIDGKARGLSGAQLTTYMGARVERPREGLEVNYGRKFLALFGAGSTSMDTEGVRHTPTFEVTTPRIAGPTITSKDAIQDDYTVANIGPFPIKLQTAPLVKIGISGLMLIVILGGILIIGMAAKTTAIKAVTS